MTWVEWHARSEGFAVAADVARRERRYPEAMALYKQAAEAEQQAFSLLDASKPRTLGATAISAVALWFKAGEYVPAEQLAHSLLASGNLPDFARADLRNLVQAIWTESAKQEAGVAFAPGEVLVSVQGGQVVTGGAPLDLIIDKVQTIQAIFYRTVEFMNGAAHRRGGRPIKEIQDACRPWLFQSVPGSYQFAVAIQRPPQSDLFREDFAPEEVAQRFLEIVGAAGGREGAPLEVLVPDQQYRQTFLKLARNLAPTGKSFERIELRSSSSGQAVAFGSDVREGINQQIRKAAPGIVADSIPVEELTGTLRAVHLDKDWLELVIDGEPKHIDGLQDTVDDVIGPMVNRPVLVRVKRTRHGKLKFVDIELIE